MWSRQSGRRLRAAGRRRRRRGGGGGDLGEDLGDIAHRDWLDQQRRQGRHAVLARPFADHRRELEELGGAQDARWHRSLARELFLDQLAGVMRVPRNPVDADDRPADRRRKSRAAIRSRRDGQTVCDCRPSGSGGDRETRGCRVSLSGSPGSDLTRREALSRGGRLLIAAAGGSAAATLAGSGSSQARGSARANWTALERSLRGPPPRPGDAGFRAAGAAENYLYASVVPAGIALCTGPHDVEACVRWARDNDVPLAARSGGHSFGGYSRTTGLQVDLRRMKSITVDADARTLRVTGTVRFSDLDGGAEAPQPVHPAGQRPPGGGQRLHARGRLWLLLAHPRTRRRSTHLHSRGAGRGRDGDGRPLPAPRICFGPAAAAVVGTLASTRR